MNRQQLLIVLASVFAGISVLLVILGIVFNLFIALIAVPFGMTAYLMWYQATGRFLDSARWRTVDPDRERSKQSQGRSAAHTRANAGGFDQSGRTRQAGPPGRSPSELSAGEAYRRLGLEPGADEAAIRQAYRRQVKDVHPDRADGNEEAFREVKEAYERLSK